MQVSDGRAKSVNVHFLEMRNVRDPDPLEKQQGRLTAVHHLCGIVMSVEL